MQFPTSASVIRVLNSLLYEFDAKLMHFILRKMSQNTFTITDLLMEKLQCSICNGYLSCGPVRVLPDGSSICGQCSPPSNHSPIYRDQAFEAVLERVSFPCGFAQHGCTKRLVFGQTAEHESKCEYRSFPCPSQGTACYWKGSTLQMLKHFTEAHPEQVVENADFKLKVDENSGGVILAPKESALFVIKYQYKADNNTLMYDIRLCKNILVLGASYKFQLINNSDPEYSFNLKTVDNLIYDDTFYGVQSSVILNLNKYLDSLDNPSCILINVNFTIRHNINQNELPDSLRCYKCRLYLIPPLFHLNGNVICCNCAETNKNYLPYDDNELLQLLNETNFPCRWRNCEFITKNNNLKMHELECQFRKYDCFMIKCKDTFTLASAANHYEKKHGCQYRNKELTFTSFAKCHGNRFIFTIKKHRIILLEYSVSITNNSKKIELNLNTSDAGITTARIQFEHQHCKVKSKSFEITRQIRSKITLNHFPPCFKEEDELTGFLII